MPLQCDKGAGTLITIFVFLFTVVTIDQLCPWRLISGVCSGAALQKTQQSQTKTLSFILSFII